MSSFNNKNFEIQKKSGRIAVKMTDSFKQFIFSYAEKHNTHPARVIRHAIELEFLNPSLNEKTAKKHKDIETRPEQLNMRIAPELWSATKKKAKDLDMSVSHYLEVIIKKHMK